VAGEAKKNTHNFLLGEMGALRTELNDNILQVT
jgi:hypothetical protein